MFLSVKFSPLLVVEDSEDDFEFIERAFAKSQIPCELHHCDEGKTAMEFLESGAVPSMVLLDLNLPGISGYQILEKIKSNEKLRSVPVIVFSSSSNESDIEECYKLGANCYIQKPVDFKKFNSTLDTVKRFWYEIAKLPI